LEGLDFLIELANLWPIVKSAHAYSTTNIRDQIATAELRHTGLPTIFPRMIKLEISSFIQDEYPSCNVPKHIVNEVELG
jgi:hypothetical protein